jgi:SAM-dependent methyltransferase
MGHDSYARLLRHFSRKSRRQKFELFATVLKPRPEDRILDIGASGRVFTAYTFEDFYPYPERVVGAGVDLQEVRSARLSHPASRYAVLDGCHLPFPDQAFDIVFSNAVIEHILGAGRQAQFAHEVTRVGKSWFVTTPNYWFLFESHYHLPFIHFLPQPLQRTYNRLLGTHIAKGTVQDLALLSARDLRKLFPTGSIAKVRITFWPETLVAYYVHPNREAAT